MVRKRKENYEIANEFFTNKSLELLEKVNNQLVVIPTKIEPSKLSLSPSKSDYAN